jgi:hypothetical protein
MLGSLLYITANKKYISYFISGVIIWLGIAGIPNIPGPFRVFYAGSGFIVLLLILILFFFWTRTNRGIVFFSFLYLKMIGYIFFALISWDVCGLGTMGRILNIETAYKSGTEPMIITQMTKIMFEFIFAWGFTALGQYLEYKNRKT